MKRPNIDIYPTVSASECGNIFWITVSAHVVERCPESVSVEYWYGGYKEVIHLALHDQDSCTSISPTFMLIAPVVGITVKFWSRKEPIVFEPPNFVRFVLARWKPSQLMKTQIRHPTD